MTYICIYVHEKGKCQLAVMFACELPDVKAQQVKIARPNLLPITRRLAGYWDWDWELLLQTKLGPGGESIHERSTSKLGTQ